MQKKIDEIFKLWQEHEGAGGQLLVTRKGKVLIEKCYGYANIETKTPMTQQTVFPVASISKPVTAMCILILHDRGLLHVDDDVRKYIADLIAFPQPLTIRQMMHHISGLRNHYDLLYLNGMSSQDCLTQDQMLRLNARQTELNFEPGQEFLYSNPNYIYMAEIVERVTGMTLNQFADRNIFTPLGMDSTFYRDKPNMLIHNRVSSYFDDGYQYTNAFINMGMYGSTSLHTTCRDLNKFMNQFVEPTLISRKTMDEIMLHIPKLGNGGTTCYAGGVRINDLLGYRYIHHGGVNPGIRTFGMVIPSEELIVTVFTNADNLPIETAGRDVARVVLGLPPRTQKTLEEYYADAVDLTNIEGCYYCRKAQELYDIRIREAEVFLNGIPMVHVKGNLYQQGRRNVHLALGQTCVLNQDELIRQLEKLTEKPAAAYMQACVGTYYAKDVCGLFSVACEDGQLYLDHLRHGRQKLHWLGGDTFGYGAKQIVFLWEGETVTGFDYRSVNVRHMPFVRFCI